MQHLDSQVAEADVERAQKLTVELRARDDLGRHDVVGVNGGIGRLVDRCSRIRVEVDVVVGIGLERGAVETVGECDGRALRRGVEYVKKPFRIIEFS